MKILIFCLILSSPLLFGRAPAVNPMFSTSDLDKSNQRNFVYLDGKPVELSKVAFKADNSVTRTVVPQVTKKTINLAPTFLMFFALSIPFFAYIFIRDEGAYESQNIDTNLQEEGKIGDVVEVDFKKDKNTEIKKAS